MKTPSFGMIFMTIGYKALHQKDHQDHHHGTGVEDDGVLLQLQRICRL